MWAGTHFWQVGWGWEQVWGLWKPSWTLLSWWLNNGDRWKPELGSALSLSHPSGRNVLAWSHVGRQDMVLHLPALLCLRYLLDTYIIPLVTAIELSVNGTHFSHRRVKYSCCNQLYT